MDSERSATGAETESPLTVLVEWPTTGLDLAAAQRLAAETDSRLRRVPGLVDARFFGDFESGTHYYLQTWRDRAALDAYMQSEEMFGSREIAAPYVAGRPSRRILVDYSPAIRRQSPTTIGSE